MTILYEPEISTVGHYEQEIPIAGLYEITASHYEFKNEALWKKWCKIFTRSLEFYFFRFLLKKSSFCLKTDNMWFCENRDEWNRLDFDTSSCAKVDWADDQDVLC